MRPPSGLHVLHNGLSHVSSDSLYNHFISDAVEWFQRFGTRFPKTAHFNGHHCMLTDEKHVDVLKPIVMEAINKALDVYNHPSLVKMKESPEEVAIATMRHKPGWGLGAHIDVYAPDGKGLVLMLCVANTKLVHRIFRFTQKDKHGAPLHYDVSTPHGTIIVFGDEAYEEWMHESRKNSRQDGTCISLTIRLREIDGYNGWAIPEKIEQDAGIMGISAKRYRSHSYAVERMNERIAKRSHIA